MTRFLRDFKSSEAPMVTERKTGEQVAFRRRTMKPLSALRRGTHRTSALILFWALALFLAAILVSPLSAQETPDKDKHKNKNGEKQQVDLTAAGADPAAPAARALVKPDEYIIGEDDLLSVTVYKEPELTQNVVVRPDGIITLPLVSEIKVSGKTPLAVQKELADMLKAYIVAPQVTVTVSDVRSKNVYVTGQVGRPGVYPLLMPTTVLQLLAKAGGLTTFANSKGIFIIRVVDGKQRQIRFPYRDVIKGKKADQNIELKAGDTVVVP
jgi:polysaccharide export outer membrane protein